MVFVEKYAEDRGEHGAGEQDYRQRNVMVMAEGERQAGDEEGGGKQSLAHWEFLPQPEFGSLAPTA
jgi:hypothetical protein